MSLKLPLTDVRRVVSQLSFNNNWTWDVAWLCLCSNSSSHILFVIPTWKSDITATLLHLVFTYDMAEKICSRIWTKTYEICSQSWRTSFNSLCRTLFNIYFVVIKERVINTLNFCNAHYKYRYDKRHKITIFQKTKWKEISVTYII